MFKVKFGHLFGFFLVFLFCHSVVGQNSTETDNIPPPSLYTEAESAYIDQWFSDFVKEMELSEEIAQKCQEITTKYSEKFENIGKDNSDITKEEITEQFNALMANQHEEIKSILTKEQYDMYQDTMEKVTWSINQRLKHL